MGKLILVVGGVRCGKSQFAENLLKNHKDVAYIATAVANDDEMKERIKHNKANRPSTWTTYEVSNNLDGILDTTEHGAYIIDSIVEYLANYFYLDGRIHDSMSFNDIKVLEKDCQKKIQIFIEKAKQCKGDVVVVTSENGLGTIPDTIMKRAARDIVGKVNQELGIASDAAWFVSCGIPVRMK